MIKVVQNQSIIDGNALSRVEAELLLHALGQLKTNKYRGRAKKLSSCTRNYFAEDLPGCKIWDNLVAKNLAKRKEPKSNIFPYVCYSVTNEGFLELLKYKKIN